MRNRVTEFSAAIVMVVLTAGAAPVLAQQTKPDNTAVNKGDQAKGAVTAGQQSNSKADVEITRKIRSAIVDDKSLSTNAHNVKIVTQNGKVTLKGPVKTDAEKKAVEAKAIAVAGARNVTNDISIVSPKVASAKPASAKTQPGKSK